MKHLHKFFNYIIESTESNGIDEDYLDELLIPISDLGVNVNVNKYRGLVKTITRGEFSGKGYISISFNLSNLQRVSGDEQFGEYRNMISDDRFWEFLDEFITFKNRIESEKVLCHFNMNQGGILNPVFSLAFIVPGDYKSDIFELEKAQDIIRRKSINGSSDFLNNITTNMDRDNKTLTVRSSMSYTDRKFNSLIRDIDKSLFDIEKVEEEGYGDFKSAIFKITLKS